MGRELVFGRDCNGLLHFGRQNANASGYGQKFSSKVLGCRDDCGLGQILGRDSKIKEFDLGELCDCQRTLLVSKTELQGLQSVRSNLKFI